MPELGIRVGLIQRETVDGNWWTVIIVVRSQEFGCAAKSRKWSPSQSLRTGQSCYDLRWSSHCPVNHFENESLNAVPIRY
jgi:hypothetical protein